MISETELWQLAQRAHTDAGIIELIRFIRELRHRQRIFPELQPSIADCDRRACEWLRGLLASEDLVAGQH